MQIEEIDKTIRYWEVFTTWKNRGRMSAVFKFIDMVKVYPSLLFRRPILGLARRLFFFRYKNVRDLDSI